VSFITIRDSFDNDGAPETSDVAKLSRREILAGVASGSDEHFTEWLRRQDAERE